jgi:hypothetical protein
LIDDMVRRSTLCCSALAPQLFCLSQLYVLFVSM